MTHWQEMVEISEARLSVKKAGMKAWKKMGMPVRTEQKRELQEIDQPRPGVFLREELERILEIQGF